MGTDSTQPSVSWGQVAHFWICSSWVENISMQQIRSLNPCFDPRPG